MLNINSAKIQFPPLRIWLAAALLVWAFLPTKLGFAIQTALSDAYSSVASFVYLTLILVFALEKGLRLDLIAQVENKPKTQIILASVLGMMPGCGGAVIIITGYAAGRLRFSAMIATLTATMGDAAFLLLAQEPQTALIILPTCLITGIVMGLIIDRIYPQKTAQSNLSPRCCHEQTSSVWLDKSIAILMVPGIILGILSLAQIPLPQEVNLFAIAALGILMAKWLMGEASGVSFNDAPPISRAASETAFIMVWVILAFVLFALLETGLGLDIANLFGSIAILTPLIAVLIGFIPGCGPQIIVTTLYLTGAIPMGALLANAISNDGDALFPAIALAKIDALRASLLTAIPALIMGYLFYFLA